MPPDRKLNQNNSCTIPAIPTKRVTSPENNRKKPRQSAHTNNPNPNPQRKNTLFKPNPANPHLSYHLHLQILRQHLWILRHRNQRRHRPRGNISLVIPTIPLLKNAPNLRLGLVLVGGCLRLGLIGDSADHRLRRLLLGRKESRRVSGFANGRENGGAGQQLRRTQDPRARNDAANLARLRLREPNEAEAKREGAAADPEAIPALGRGVRRGIRDDGGVAGDGGGADDAVAGEGLGDGARGAADEAGGDGGVGGGRGLDGRDGGALGGPGDGGEVGGGDGLGLEDGAGLGEGADELGQGGGEGGGVRGFGEDGDVVGDGDGEGGGDDLGDVGGRDGGGGGGGGGGWGEGGSVWGLGLDGEGGAYRQCRRHKWAWGGPGK